MKQRAQVVDRAGKLSERVRIIVSKVPRPFPMPEQLRQASPTQKSYSPALSEGRYQANTHITRRKWMRLWSYISRYSAPAPGRGNTVTPCQAPPLCRAQQRLAPLNLNPNPTAVVSSLPQISRHVNHGSGTTPTRSTLSLPSTTVS